MNVISSCALILAAVVFTSFQVEAAAIESCLGRAQKLTRAIDQKQNTEFCFQKHALNLTKAKCYELATKHPVVKKYPDLQENLNSICFYQSLESAHLKSCIADAARFKFADNQDEALFECYMQFQSQTTQRECVEISRKLILPHRKNHMLRHCQENY